MSLFQPTALTAPIYCDATGKEQQQELAAGPFPKERSHPAALPKEPFALTTLEAARYVTRRQIKLVGRDKMLLQGRVMQVGSCWLVHERCQLPGHSGDGRG